MVSLLNLSFLCRSTRRGSDALIEWELIHSIHSDSSMYGTNNNKMSDVGVSYTQCLFVSRVGSASSPWVFHFPTTTAITPSYNSSNFALLTKRQCRYANSIKEIDSRRDTMQNLAPVPESEERIATLWKIVAPWDHLSIVINKVVCIRVCPLSTFQ